MVVSPAAVAAVVVKRLYRIIDFKRNKLDIRGHCRPYRVRSRTVPPASRCCTMPTVKNAISLHPLGVKQGDRDRCPAKRPTSSPATRFPWPAFLWVPVLHNIELNPGRGGQFCRAAGTYAQLVAKEGKYALLRMPSGEVRKVLATCLATIGQVGNIQHENISLGKAGRNRWLESSSQGSRRGHEPGRPSARRW